MTKTNDQRMKKDGGKDSRPELLDPNWLLGVGRVLKFGAEKYEAELWREGMNYSRLVGSLQRHMLAFQAGEDTDPETGLSHLLHASCCLMFLYTYTGDSAYGGFDDRVFVQEEPLPNVEVGVYDGRY